MTATRLLRQRDFSLLLLARLVANIGAQMQTVALGLQIYAKTSDPFYLGLVGLSQFLPFVVLILPAGQVADRQDRRRVLLGCYALQCLCALALLALTWIDVASVWPIFAVMTLLGVTRAFAMPAGQALLPNLVPRELFGRAIALNSTTVHVSTIVGPTLGGIAYLAGAQTVYAIVTAIYLAALALMGMMTSRPPTPDGPHETGLRSLLSGLHFVRAKSVVLGAISLDLFAVLFGGATALLPVYASDILHVGPTGLGLLRSAPGVGSMVCALWLWVTPMHRHAGAYLFVSIFIFGFATVLFGISTHFILSLFALTVLGVTDMMSVYVRNMLVQLQTPDNMRGRVSAVSSVFIGASNELGEFESGLTAAWWGTVRAVAIGGMATVAVGGLWMKLFPELRNMDRFPEPVRGEEPTRDEEALPYGT